ncbi:MAG: site-specific DNA-methyltransferase [Planctomycetes bacterium]|nr:site-specific DNA-methyltransferase [Planctomycetota bacterium]
MVVQLDLFRGAAPATALARELARFRRFGTSTRVGATVVGPLRVETFVNEFWTSRQRAAHSLHEVSYRACFKPQLPRFFIDRLSRPGEVVHDPYMGRGTTALEAALSGRVPAGGDINPLSRILLEPRLRPPREDEVRERLEALDLAREADGVPEDLGVFYHPETLREIGALRAWLLSREASGTMDPVDRWVRMVAVNRLTGHSPGFFSVYTLPPNQAVSVASQRRINERRRQTPPRRDVRELILAKTRSLLRSLGDEARGALSAVAGRARFYTGPAGSTPELEDGSVRLVVTSPPFLDVVDYAGDNWLRLWFSGLDAEAVGFSQHPRLEDWRAEVTAALAELRRVVAPGGHVAFEAGEVRGGRLRLEEEVLPCGAAAGLEPLLVLVNAQAFTKTAHCWGVDNRLKGTNTNRVVLFRRA